MINIQRLTYSYPGAARPALRNVNLQAQAGEFILLAGPSGAGKSTLLRCLNGLTPHFSGGVVAGRIEVDGLNVVAAGPRALSRVVGFVFQDPENQAVLDNVEAEVAFGLENAAVPPAEMRLRVDETLNLLDLSHLRHRPLVTLSGGERQRVAIATALVLRPRILAVDEPTSQLDPQSAEEVLQALVRLNEDLGLSVVLVEHRLERVLRYVDRLVYLEEGQVVADAAVRPALARIPRSLAPPLPSLALALQWQPLPLTIKEGLPFARATTNGRAANGAGAEASSPAGPPAGASPPLLQVRDLHFTYGRQPVLSGVNLDIAPAEAVILMGRNGSGKSTLLKCLVGLLRPSAGEVRLDGRVTAAQSVAEICRQVAYLPQNADDLLFAETVADELAITLRNHGLDPAVEADLASLLAQLGLVGLAEAYPRDLSVGQRQRVALGAVCVTGPRLMLLDEPTRGLDYQAKHNLVKLWRQWQARGGALLLVTHDVEFAAQIADRVLLLSQGEIIADGPATEVLGASPLFAPQMARLFPGRGWLTLPDALAALAEEARCPV
jgi:energy-coupling factor transport system ATP-binding protein